MNVVPVADQSEDQQQSRDHQQAGSLRRVNLSSARLGIILVLQIGVGHSDIVARWEPALGPGCPVIGSCP
jgi:hypothetical protein